MKSNPLISVVIPAYNEEHFIGATLESLQQQTFRDFEVIVVDNFSSDRTAAIASRMGARVFSEPKRGVCSARQCGTQAALGQIIVSTDADTTFDPQWLSKIANEFKDPDLVALTGSFQFVNAPFWGRVFARALFGIVDKIYSSKGEVKYMPASNTAFRKEFWPGYNVNLTQGGDEFDLLKKFKKIGKVKYLAYNSVYTSSRRLRRGLVYNFFVTGLMYYMFDYLIGRRTGKSVLGSYAAIRKDKANPFLALARSALMIVVMLGIFSFSTHHVLAKQLLIRTANRVGNLEDRTDMKIKHLRTRK